MARGKGTAAVAAKTVVEDEQVQYNDGIASRVQKRRQPSSFGPPSPEKRIKREGEGSPSAARGGGEVAGKKVLQEVAVEDVEVLSDAGMQGHGLRGPEEHEKERAMPATQEKTLHTEDVARPQHTSIGQNGNTGVAQQEIQDSVAEEDHQVSQEAHAERLTNLITLDPIPSQGRIKYNDSGGPEPISDQEQWLKEQGWPVVKLLADQILEIIARSPFTQLEIYHSEFVASGFEDFSALCSIFEQSKELYRLTSAGIPFLQPDSIFTQFGDFAELDDESPGFDSRKTNAATAISILLGPPNEDLLYTRDRFLDIFVGPGERLGDWHARLLSAIAIHCSVHRYESRSPSQPAEESSSTLQALIDTIRRDDPSRALDDVETKVVDIFRQIDEANRGGDQEVSAKGWNLKDTVRDCLPHLKTYAQALLGLPISNFEVVPEVIKAPENSPVPETNILIPESLPAHETTPVPELEEHRQINGLPTATSNDHDTGTAEPERQAVEPQLYVEDTFDQDEMIRRAAIAAHAALTGQPFPESYDSPMSYNDYSPQIQHPDPFQPVHQSPYAQNSYAEELRARAASANRESSQQIPTTAEQYERARLAATAKAAAKNSKNATPTPSQRRPWTQDEENALMTGLDRVQGPHWSQILAMYGAGGTISEVLKDRNQVQLKDKARNLKLFFLKSGHEVPHYLKHVTGELKTRAPATAAKNEARERLQESAGEDKAAMNAISVLAAGRQGFAASSPQLSEPATPMSGLQGSQYGGVGSPAHERFVGQYGQLMDEQEDEEDDDEPPDEMMMSALQQAIAIGQQSNG